MAKKRKVVPIDELRTMTDVLEAARFGPPVIYVLAGAAFVENSLGSLLEHVLIKGDTTHNLLNNARAPLSTYSARNELCYCMGLISRVVFNNVKTIGDVRNAFAHSHVPIDFDEPNVVEKCSGFTVPSLVGKDYKPVDASVAVDGRAPNDFEKYTMAVWQAFAAISMAHMGLKTDFSLVLMQDRPGLFIYPTVVYRE